MGFIKEHWVEIVVAAVVISLFVVFAIGAPQLIPGFGPYWAKTTLEMVGAALSPEAFWVIMMSAVTVVYGGFAAAITHGIRNKNQPDFSWFTGLTESPTASVRANSSSSALIRKHSQELEESKPLLEHELSSVSVDEIKEHKAPSSKPSFLSVSPSHSSSPMQNRMSQFQAALRRDSESPILKTDVKAEIAATEEREGFAKK